MIALGNTAFDTRLTPFMLYSTAATAQTEEVREDLEAFARDFAEIQDLPEYRVAVLVIPDDLPEAFQP